MQPKTNSIVIGWREVVALPGLGLGQIAAKVDTGARTSALHAEQVEIFDRDGIMHARFFVPHAGIEKSVRCVAPIVDNRAIKNTSGNPEDRIVVRTLLVLGGRRWSIDLSLADRQAMAFPLILGRTAIRGRRILVHPGRSNLTMMTQGLPT